MDWILYVDFICIIISIISIVIVFKSTKKRIKNKINDRVILYKMKKILNKEIKWVKFIR